jgi:hypothetical protein
MCKYIVWAEHRFSECRICWSNLLIDKVTTGLLKGNLSNRIFFIWLTSCAQISSVQRVWRRKWRNPSAHPASRHGDALRVSVSCSSLISWISFHLLRSRGLWTGSMNCRVPARRHLSVPGRPTTQVRNLLGASYFCVERNHCLFSWNTSSVAHRIFFHYICLTMHFVVWRCVKSDKKIVSLNFYVWILVCSVIREHSNKHLAFIKCGKFLD